MLAVVRGGQRDGAAGVEGDRAREGQGSHEGAQGNPVHHPLGLELARALELEVRIGGQGAEALLHRGVHAAILPAEAQHRDGEGRRGTEPVRDPQGQLGGLDDLAHHDRIDGLHEEGPGPGVHMGRRGPAAEGGAVPEVPGHRPHGLGRQEEGGGDPREGEARGRQDGPLGPEGQGTEERERDEEGSHGQLLSTRRSGGSTPACRWPWGPWWCPWPGGRRSRCLGPGPPGRARGCTGP